MNSRNARSKTQRELSGRAVRKRPALMVTFLTLLGLILGACGTPATDMTPPLERHVQTPYSSWWTHR